MKHLLLATLCWFVVTNARPDGRDDDDGDVGKVEDRGGFVKVFSHDTSGGFFTTYNALRKNPGDPNARLYSILYQLEDFRGSDGSFHFKLCYPELTGIGGSSCNEWIQSSNPATGRTIRGFKAISLAFTRGSLGSWKGIGKSVSSTNFIDDYPQNGAWWTAIGARRGHPKGSSKIPGPQPHVVTKVELYAIKAEGCRPGFSLWNGKCYQFIQKALDWERASSVCQSQRSALVSISGKTENSYVTSLFEDKWNVRTVWIGASYLESKRWTWIDGSAWTGYTNWAPGEPNGNGRDEKISKKINMYGRRGGAGPLGTWNDHPGYYRMSGLVCSYKL